MTATTDRCRDLHEALECLPMITHPFDYDDMQTPGYTFSTRRGRFVSSVEGSQG